jgi:beta-lactamase class A
LSSVKLRVERLQVKVVLCSLGIAVLSSCRLPGQAAEPASGPLALRTSLARDNTTHAAGTRQQRARDEAVGTPIPPPPRSLSLRGSTESKAEPTKAMTRSTADPAFTATGALAARLKAVIDDALARGVTHRVGIAVYDLATGQAVGLNASTAFRPASVIKLAVLVAAYRARGGMTAAQFDRLRPDLQRMITVSDNAATRRLVRRLGPRQVNAAIRAVGIRQFRVGESGSREWVLQGSRAAPADTALLLAKIARREVVSRAACDEMLALLGAQQRRGRIPAGLPASPDLWVGNKTGTLNGVVNDVGIVLEPPRGIGYTLAVFTSGTRSESAGEQLLADLSAAVYGYMAARGRHG